MAKSQAGLSSVWNKFPVPQERAHISVQDSSYPNPRLQADGGAAMGAVEAAPQSELLP